MSFNKTSNAKSIIETIVLGAAKEAVKRAKGRGLTEGMGAFLGSMATITSAVEEQAARAALPVTYFAIESQELRLFLQTTEATALVFGESDAFAAMGVTPIAWEAMSMTARDAVRAGYEKEVAHATDAIDMKWAGMPIVAKQGDNTVRLCRITAQSTVPTSGRAAMLFLEYTSEPFIVPMASVKMLTGTIAVEVLKQVLTSRN